MRNKEKIMFVLSLVIMFFSGIVSIYAVNCLYNSADVSYDNSISGLTSTNVQASLDELYGHCTDYTEIREMIYPVGSIYISVTDDTVAKVETRFGGSWEKFGEGKTLVSASNDYPINTTGGSVSESYTPAGNNTGGTVQSHTLTINQIPSHTHNYNYVNGQGANQNHTESYYIQYSTNTWPSVYYTVTASGSAGGGQGHTHGFTNPTFTGTAATISHMQPYITVYMYKRVS